MKLLHTYIITLAIATSTLMCMHPRPSHISHISNTPGFNPDIIKTENQENNEDPLEHILSPNNVYLRTGQNIPRTSSVYTQAPKKRPSIQKHQQHNTTHKEAHCCVTSLLSQALCEKDWERVKGVLAEYPHQRYKMIQNGERPLDIAARNGQSDIVEMCLHPYLDDPLDIEDQWEITKCIPCKHTLKEAITHGNTQTGIIIAYAPKANYRTYCAGNDELTALDIATQYENVDIAYALLQNNDQLIQENPTHLLMLSIKYDHPELVKRICHDPHLKKQINQNQIQKQLKEEHLKNTHSFKHILYTSFNC